MSVYTQVDVFAYTGEVLGYLIIRNPYDFQSPGLQFFGSFPIFFLIFRITMLGTIQFYNQSSFMAVKIYNIVVYHFLPQKPNRIVSQKVIPQMPFFLCHIFTKDFCIARQGRIMFPFQKYHLLDWGNDIPQSKIKEIFDSPL